MPTNSHNSQEDPIEISRQLLIEALTKQSLTNEYTGEVKELSPTTVLNLAKYIFSKQIPLGDTLPKLAKPSNVPKELASIFSKKQQEDTLNIDLEEL